ncbi:MAG: polyhydroxyalkanoate synthesis regulator DNA-binding domain-containing protein [Acidobacteriota bacterium]
MRVIKRYSNRKLYDTQDRCYVTLGKIAERLRAGEDVQIIDKASGDDITAVVLSQILVDSEKRHDSTIAPSFLADLVRKGSDGVSAVVKKSKEALTEIGKRVPVERIERAGELSKREVMRLVKAVETRAAESQKAVEARVQTGIKSALQRLDIPSKQDIEKLHARLDQLHDRLQNRNGSKSHAKKAAAPRRRKAAKVASRG